MRIVENLKNIYKNEVIWILALFIIGFVPRLYVFLNHQVIDYDGVYYALLGKNLFSGAGYIESEGIYQWYYPPLYPANIGFLWLLFRNLTFSSKFVSLIFGMTNILLCYLIARKVYGKPTAVISGILVSLHPNLIRFSTIDTAESQFIFLLLFIFILTISYINKAKILFFCLIGCLFGLLFLSKPAGIQYFASYIILLVLVGVIKKWNIIKTIQRIFLMVILFSIIILPYLNFLKNHFGYWTLSELTTRNLRRSLLSFSGDNPEKVYQLNDEGTELRYFTSERYSGEHLSVLKIFKNDPENFFKRYRYNLKQELYLVFNNIKLFTIPVIVFLFIHFLGIKRNKNGVIHELIFLVILFPLLTAPIISSHSLRWVLPMIPIIIIWSSHGILELENRMKFLFNKYSYLFKRYFIISVMILWIIGITVPFLFRVETDAKMYPHEHKELGFWMKENLPLTSSTLVMAASPHVAFYAETKFKIMPWGNTTEILKYADYHHVDYLVIDDHFLKRARSQLIYLSNIDSTSGVQLIKSIYHSNGKKIKLYQL